MVIETLIATMHQTDRSLLEKMNIQTDAVVVNQCDRECCEEFSFRGHRIKWIDTVQRGLSNSRNMAFSHAVGDICLLADDDIVYEERYDEIVENAFAAQPEADITAFNIRRINQKQKQGGKTCTADRKAPAFSYYGSVRLAFRRKKLEENKLRFHPDFGAGAKYGSGEESLLLRQCRKKGLHIYENTACLCTVDCSESTWFRGFDETFYFNKGAFLAAAYGKTAWFYSLYFLLQSRRISKLPAKTVMRSMKNGMKDYRKNGSL